MSIEHHYPQVAAIEQSVVKIGAKMWQLPALLARCGVVLFFDDYRGDVPDNSDGSEGGAPIPEQFVAHHDTLDDDHELRASQALRDCRAIFEKAAGLDIAGTESYIVVADPEEERSEYVGLAGPEGTLFLNRRLVDAPSEGYEYWIDEEIIVTDKRTGSPNFYTKRINLDTLGYLTLDMIVPADEEVETSLGQYASRLYYDTLAAQHVKQLVPVSVTAPGL